MRIVRFTSSKYQAQYGWVHEGDLGVIEGDIFGEFRRLETEIQLEKARLLAPVLPGKIICVARNYIEHARERNVEVPETPMIFLKPPSAVIAHEDAIQIPPQSARVEHEAELAIIIAKAGRWIDTEKARQYIYGYTIANDVTARDLQLNESQWTRAKGFDTFCPLGPWIETELDVTDLLITCRVNGELRQMASTKEMIFPVTQLVTFISNIMTLYPGDVILTGTPAGVGALEKGDNVEITIEGIGSLSNMVK
ncbi:MAG TPA: fumarylacetoacetate hydrolase family protein [Anaerolineaceae bacterium]|nr:fumarylacetoacetate hydrolase family protein [Anaerolineaceae bacterium]HUM63067.1 fumarylacetoacetate hydrolase family protein [Anaerolineaceae bacterium]